MSKISTFVDCEIVDCLSKCKLALDIARKNLDKMCRDPQKDGADSEKLQRAYRILNKLENAV